MHGGEEHELPKKITVGASIRAGEPIVRGRRFTVAHVLPMLAVGDGRLGFWKSIAIPPPATNEE